MSTETNLQWAERMAREMRDRLYEYHGLPADFRLQPGGVKDPATRQPWELPDPVPPIVHPVNPYKDGGSPDPVEIVIPPPSEPKEPRVDTEWPPAPPMPAPKRRK